MTLINLNFIGKGFVSIARMSRFYCIKEQHVYTLYIHNKKGIATS